METISISDKFKALGNKYNLPVTEHKDNTMIMSATNTFGERVGWIIYYSDTNFVDSIGNTDYLNIWLCRTREDFTANKIQSFIEDLNSCFELKYGTKFVIEDLIDPEDWQAIAGVEDAYEDPIYSRR